MKKIRLDGVVGWDILADDLAEKIKGESEIELIANSGGGDITEGFAIYNLLNDFEGRIVAKVDLAASMMSIIVMAADEIIMSENSSLMMIHRPWGGMAGNSEEFRRQADNLDKMELMITNIYAAKSGLDKEVISKMLDDETYMNADEAKEFGFIDMIDAQPSGDFSAVAMQAMAASEKVDFSKSKFLAKIQAMKEHKTPTKQLFKNCDSLASIEGVIRNHFKASQAEATAIVAAVKKQVQGDLELKNEITEAFKNFKF